MTKTINLKFNFKQLLNKSVVQLKYFKAIILDNYSTFIE